MTPNLACTYKANNVHMKLNQRHLKYYKKCFLYIRGCTVSIEGLNEIGLWTYIGHVILLLKSLVLKRVDSHLRFIYHSSPSLVHV